MGKTIKGLNTPAHHRMRVGLSQVWLENFARPSDTWFTLDSYALKHAVERWCHYYISEAALQEAVKTLGFKTREVFPNGRHEEYKIHVPQDVIKRQPKEWLERDCYILGVSAPPGTPQPPLKDSKQYVTQEDIHVYLESTTETERQLEFLKCLAENLEKEVANG